MRLFLSTMGKLIKSNYRIFRQFLIRQSRIDSLKLWEVSLYFKTGVPLLSIVAPHSTEVKPRLSGLAGRFNGSTARGVEIGLKYPINSIRVSGSGLIFTWSIFSLALFSITEKRI